MAAVLYLKVVLELATVPHIHASFSTPSEVDCSRLCILNETCYRYWSSISRERSPRSGNTAGTTTITTTTTATTAPTTTSTLKTTTTTTTTTTTAPTTADKVPGDWEDWAMWSPCSVTCGGGKKSRSRVCDMTSHGNLTAPCEGSENEIVDCHTFTCRPLARTCSDWGNRGLTTSTMADIDPDKDDGQLEPTVVYCDMTSENGVGVTVIGHQAEKEQKVDGYEEPGEYKLEIVYNVTLPHTIAIIDASENCRQFVRWRCKHAIIHDTQIVTGWRNRTGGIADYFGNALPGSGMCTCGMDHSCADNEKLACNCDKNDNQWREDSGNLSYKADLPVTEFLAGDTA